MKRKFHVGFGEEGACFLPDVNQERRRALTLHTRDRTRQNRGEVLPESLPYKMALMMVFQYSISASGSIISLGIR